MWTILNFHVKKLAMLIVVGLSINIAFASSTDKGNYYAKKSIVIKKAEVVKLNNKKLMQVYGKRNIGSAKQTYIIKVQTEEPVNLLLSSSPIITINGVETITKFEPYQNSTFYAFVTNKQLLKGDNKVEMIWPDMPKKKQRLSGVNLIVN